MLFRLASQWGLLGSALAQNQCGITSADVPVSTGTILFVWACGSLILGLTVEAKR